VILGKARIIKQECRYLIALVAKSKVSKFPSIGREISEGSTLPHYMMSCLELNLQIISLFKADVDNVLYCYTEISAKIFVQLS